MKKMNRLVAGLALGGLVAPATMAYELKLGNTPVEFHGFLSQGVLASTEYDYLGKTTGGSAEFNEFGLNASISPFNRTRITAQAFSFDLGNVGNYAPILDYASIEYTVNDHLAFRGGRIRRPGGIYNHIQDVDLARTSVLLPQGVYNPRWRDFSTSIDGGTVFGSFNMGKMGSISYEGYAGLMNLSMEGGVARSFQDGIGGAGKLNTIDNSLMAGGQLWWNTPLPGLRAGASLGQVFDFTWKYSVNTPFGPFPIRSEANIPFQQYSLEYVYKSWTFQAEYYTYNVIERDYAGGGKVPTALSRNRPDSWYVGASYRFNKWLEMGTYYSEAYASASDRDGSTRAVKSDAFQKDIALSARFDLKDWWIFKLEGHHYNGTGSLNDQVNNPLASRTDKGWWMLAAKTTFSF